ncbi:hypothetical protein [Stenotrophomonas phage BUCTxx99]|nr:hypothetical protein [Stenotrophomonas phage BUCTxx99]
MNNNTLRRILFVAAFIPFASLCVLVGCSRQVDPVTGRPVTTMDGFPNQIDRAAAACKAGGKQLKSYKDTSSGVEFTCE